MITHSSLCKILEPDFHVVESICRMLNIKVFQVWSGDKFLMEFYCDGLNAESINYTIKAYRTNAPDKYYADYENIQRIFQRFFRNKKINSILKDG